MYPKKPPIGRSVYPRLNRGFLGMDVPFEMAGLDMSNIGHRGKSIRFTFGSAIAIL